MLLDFQTARAALDLSCIPPAYAALPPRSCVSAIRISLLSLSLLNLAHLHVADGRRCQAWQRNGWAKRLIPQQHAPR